MMRIDPRVSDGMTYFPTPSMSALSWVNKVTDLCVRGSRGCSKGSHVTVQ